MPQEILASDLSRPRFVLERQMTGSDGSPTWSRVWDFWFRSDAEAALRNYERTHDPVPVRIREA